MQFDRYLRDSWSRHADHAPQVFDALPVGRALAESTRELLAWADLVTHVAGEHLGRWSDGLVLLEGVLDDPYLRSDPARRQLNRDRAVLTLASGDRATAEGLLQGNTDPDWPVASSWVRVLTAACTALSAQGAPERAHALLTEAIEAAAYGPRAQDPAARALAVKSNDLAMDLEDVASRTPEQDALMVFAAQTARTWWGVAGGEVEVLLADVRLASTRLATGQAEAASAPAEAAAAASEAPGTQPGFRIQAMLVLARVRLALGDVDGTRSAVLEADAAYHLLPEAYQGYYHSRIEAVRESLVEVVAH